MAIGDQLARSERRHPDAVIVQSMALRDRDPCLWQRAWGATSPGETPRALVASGFWPSRDSADYR